MSNCILSVKSIHIHFISDINTVYTYTLRHFTLGDIELNKGPGSVTLIFTSRLLTGPFVNLYTEG